MITWIGFIEIPYLSFLQIRPSRSMNFLSHYSLDPNPPHDLFTVGVAIPDILSVAGRHLRLPWHALRKWKNDPLSPTPQDWIVSGLLRHEQADKWFHQSEFFDSERKLILPFLQQIIPQNPNTRYFFITHIAVELWLDRVLLMENATLAHQFYQRLKLYSGEDIKDWLATITGKEYSPFSPTFDRFTQHTYLYRYAENDGFLEAFHRTLRRVGLNDLEGVSPNTFIDVFQPYQEGLIHRFHQWKNEINLQDE